MSVARDSTTSATLLDRLRIVPLDEGAWNAFVDRYAPYILRWCRKYGAQSADADEIVQEVLLKLLEKLGSFERRQKSSFRKWLRTVTHNAWCDFCRTKEPIRGQGSGDTAVFELLATIEAGDELTRELEEAHEHAVFEEALKRVQVQVDERTYLAFALTVLDGLSTEEAASRLGMTFSNLYSAKSRVAERLRKIVEQLSRD